MYLTDVINKGFRQLQGVDISEADFRRANLSEADFRRANLSEANLSGADLSGARMPDLIQVERCDEGWVAYKYFGCTTYSNNWKVEPGSILEETVNRIPTDECGSGVNVATEGWVERNPLGYSGDVWKVLIRWEWAHLMVIPYSSDGKFRCGKCELIERVG